MIRTYLDPLWRALAIPPRVAIAVSLSQMLISTGCEFLNPPWAYVALILPLVVAAGYGLGGAACALGADALATILGQYVQGLMGEDVAQLYSPGGAADVELVTTVATLAVGLVATFRRHVESIGRRGNLASAVAPCAECEVRNDANLMSGAPCVVNHGRDGGSALHEFDASRSAREAALAAHDGAEVPAPANAEWRLADNMALLGRWSELSRTMVAVFKDNALVFISPAAQGLFAQRLLRPWTEISPTVLFSCDCGPSIQARLCALDGGAEMPPTKLKIRHADDTCVEIEVEAVTCASAGGATMLARISNLSLLGEIEAARLESDARLHAFLEVSGVYAWMKDNEGRYVYLSGTCAKLDARFASEMLGKRSVDIWPPRIAEQFKVSDNAVLLDGQIHESIHEVTLGDGSPISLLCVRFPYLDRSGREYVGGVALDISESRRLIAARDELRDWSRALQSGQEEERRRLARELHDEFGSVLSVLKSQVALLTKYLHDDNGAGTLFVSQINALIHSLLVVTDRVVEGLRPSVLEHLGLCVAIERLTKRFSTDYQIVVDCELETPKCSLTDDQSLALYRILQECLTNVAKHAQASAVSVVLRDFERSIELTVRDNGKGMDDKDKLFHGHGFVGMRERAGLVGGSLTITANPRAGLQVVACLPVQRAAPHR